MIEKLTTLAVGTVTVAVAAAAAAAANVIELYERIISCLKYIYLLLECVNKEITTN